MTTNHIDQLAQWWENAEPYEGPQPGDIVIEDRRDLEGGFDVWPYRKGGPEPPSATASCPAPRSRDPHGTTRLRLWRP